MEWKMPERIGSPDNDPPLRDGKAAPSPDNDRAGKPSLRERAIMGAAVLTAAAALAAPTYADVPSHHGRDEGGRDDSGQTVKPDRVTGADKNAHISQEPAEQAFRPSAGDRVVAKASAPVPAADNGVPPGKGLKEWIDEDVKEFMTAVGEDVEERNEE
jgi:hypothetical protein